MLHMVLFNSHIWYCGQRYSERPVTKTKISFTWLKRIRALFDWVSVVKHKIQGNHNGHSEERKIPLRANENSVKTTKLPKGRENTNNKIVMGVSYTSGERERREFSGLITERRKGKTSNHIRLLSTFNWKLPLPSISSILNQIINKPYMITS